MLMAAVGKILWAGLTFRGSETNRMAADVREYCPDLFPYNLPSRIPYSCFLLREGAETLDKVSDFCLVEVSHFYSDLLSLAGFLYRILSDMK